MADALETMNKRYVEIKGEIQNASNQVEAWGQQLETLEDDRTIAQGKKLEAKRNGDTVAEQAAEEEIKKIEAQVKTVLEECKKEKEKVEGLKSKLDRYMDLVKNNPAMKQHLEEVLSKRYGRKLRDIEEGKQDKDGKLVKGKKQVEAEKAKMDRLKDIIEANPTLENTLTQIISGKQKIKRLNDELGKLDMAKPEEAKRIAEIQNEMPNIQKKLISNEDFLKYNFKTLFPKLKKDEQGENITEADIKALIEKGVTKSSTFERTVSSESASLDRQLRGYDKQTRYYEDAMAEVDYRRTQKPARKSKDGQEPDYIETPAPKGKADSRSNLPEPAQKPKWYQFITRIKNWWNRNTREDGESAKAKSSTVNAKSSKNTPFRDSMKYEIVQDLAKKMEEEQFKASRDAVRQDMRDEREDEGK